MVTVAHDKVVQVTLMPVIEITRIVMRCLFLAPHIKSLIHYDKPHLVAQVKQFGSGRIMGTTYAITAHFLQDFQLTFNGTNVHGSSQAT